MTGSDLIDIYRTYEAQSDEALDTLLRAVRAYAMAITGDEDLSQEVSLLVWRKLHLYNPEKGSFAGWTRTIITNCRRMQNRNQMASLTVPVTDDHLVDLAHRSGNGQKPTNPVLRDLLLHGPKQTRELLSLACSTGDITQAGKLLGLTANQIRHQRRILKKYVAQKST